MSRRCRLQTGLAAAAFALALASQWRLGTSLRLSQFVQASASQDIAGADRRIGSAESDRGIGMKPDASKLSAWRTAEVYGHDWVEEREDQARGEESGVRSSSHSAWKEIKEEDSIMMVVQESRSSETAGLFGTRRRTRKGRMLEERHEPERKAEDSSISNETTCDWERRQKLHDHLHNVVLIMNFNWGWIAEKSMDFWKRVYGPIFDNIVFVSKDVLPEIGLEARAPARFRSDWRNQYWCLPRIMARFPHADGFLWTNDDVMLNYWNLLKADKTKLWLPNDPNDIEVRHFPFNEKAELDGVEDNNTPQARRRASRAYSMLDEEDRKQFDLSSGPHTGMYPKRICDLYYVPGRLSEKLSFDIIPPFREARVFAESAIPSMFYALEHPDKWDHILDDMVYSWDHWHPEEKVRESYDPAKKWKPEISALHPWKISKPAMKAKMVQSFSQGDSCICQDPELAELCAAKE